MTVSGGDVIQASDINGLTLPPSPLPLGVIRRGRRETNSTATSGTGERPVLRVDGVPVWNGRLYRIYTGPVVVDGSVANDGCRMVLRTSTSGSATTSSTQVAIAQRVIPNISLPEDLSVSVSYAPGADQTLSVLLSIVRQSGTGVFQTLGDATFPTELFIEDCGLDPGDTGTDL